MPFYLGFHIPLKNSLKLRLIHGITIKIYLCFLKEKNMRKLQITELDRLSPESFKKSNKIPLVVVLDHVRSLNNVGSVFRTADAFRVHAVFLCGITAQPPHAES